MSLLELFNTVPDPREAGKVRYSLGSVLFVGLCGVLCGCESWSDIEDYCETKFDWLCLFVDLSNGVPSEWTFRRIFTLLDPLHMERLLRDYAASLIKGRGQGSDHIAIDGKALRGSGRHDWTCLQSVSAWCHTNGLVLSETAVDIKSQETVAIPLLLKNLDLKGKTVTIDAAGCQKSIAGQIIEQKGNYVFGLKKNHPILYKAAVERKAIEGETDSNRLEDAFDHSHGRCVRRRYFSYNTKGLPGIDQWVGAQSIIAVETIASKNNDPKAQGTSQWRYYLSSHPCNHPKLTQYVRNHWGIENKLHWILDVQMNEDDDQKAERKSARSFALLRRIALNIVKTKDTTPKRSIKRKLKRAGWDNTYLENLLVTP